MIYAVLPTTDQHFPIIYKLDSWISPADPFFYCQLAGAKVRKSTSDDSR
jgi:hypothetical protein